jgi:four helix bundle protein
MDNSRCKINGRSEENQNGQLAAHVPRDISERLLSFAVRVGKTVNALPATRLGRHVAGQLVRSGTSAAPNYEEGCAAESRADFFHKLSICLKELRESRFWIRLIVESGLLPKKKMTDLQDECTQLCKILAQSIVTAKSKTNRGKR